MDSGCPRRPQGHKADLEHHGRFGLTITRPNAISWNRIWPCYSKSKWTLGAQGGPGAAQGHKADLERHGRFGLTITRPNAISWIPGNRIWPCYSKSKWESFFLCTQKEKVLGFFAKSFPGIGRAASAGPAGPAEAASSVLGTSTKREKPLARQAFARVQNTIRKPL